MNPPRRQFLDWTQPLLPAAVDFLTRHWQGEGALDLSGLLVVVPTSSAARRLRGALAARAAEMGTAVWSPLVVTPEGLLVSRSGRGVGVASRAATILAWAGVLESIDFARFEALFPVPPDAHDRRWALKTAGALLDLKRILEEGGRTIRDAAKDLGRNHPEAARWSALAALESMAVDRLRVAGLADPSAFRIAAAHDPELPDRTTRICLIGVPDSIAIVRTALQAHAARGVPIDVVIHAPESLGEAFDDWGRPVPEVWGVRHIEIPDPRRTIAVATRPADQAAALLQEWKNSGLNAHRIALASADASIAPVLLSSAAAEGLEIHDPQGAPVLQYELLRVMQEIATLLQSRRIDPAGRLLRIPEVLELVRREACAGHSCTGILRQWDEFCQSHLPQFLTDAAAIAQREASSTCVPAVLQWLSRTVNSLADDDSGAIREELPGSLYGNRTFESAEAYNAFAAALEAWRESVDEVLAGAAVFAPGLPVAIQMELALSLLRDTRIYPEGGGKSMQLYGWLELPWVDAPRLAIAGMNDGHVPDSFTTDPWFPDGARAALDLPTSTTRLARDSYLLTSLIECRRGTGELRLIAGRESGNADPLKPSRLLFQCPSAELPRRVQQLFAEDPAEGAGRTPPAWHRAWRLVPGPPPRDAPAFSRLSVTAFREYLACPFRFYLKQVLGMQEMDADKSELDPRDFGSLIHDSLERLHRDDSLRDSTDAGEIRAFLHDAVAELAHARYGASLSVPVFIQVESAKNRLAAFAPLHASERLAGWRCESAEIRFPELPGSQFPVRIGGMEIRGRIDLIERHQETGALRIVDYKTASTPVAPGKAHLASIRGDGREIPEWQIIRIDGKLYRWVDLQLPLYAGIVSAHYGTPVAAGYFNLPRAVSQTALCMWDDLNGEILDQARQCAQTIVKKISACEFWPPADKPKYDDFASLVFGTAADSFDPCDLLAHAEIVQSRGR